LPFVVRCHVVDCCSLLIDCCPGYVDSGYVVPHVCVYVVVYYAFVAPRSAFAPRLIYVVDLICRLITVCYVYVDLLLLLYVVARLLRCTVPYVDARLHVVV